MNYDLSIAQDRRTAAQLAASNPTPSSGQLCIETDTGWVKAGDGATAYRLLSPFRLSGEERQSADDVYAAMGLSDSRDNGTDPVYTEYVALLNQSDTDDPVATVLTNTLGVTPTWSRFVEGNYIMTATGLLVAGKVAILQVGPGTSTSFFGAALFEDDDQMAVESYLINGTLADNLLQNTTIHIRIYP